MEVFNQTRSIYRGFQPIIVIHLQPTNTAILIDIDAVWEKLTGCDNNKTFILKTPIKISPATHEHSKTSHNYSSYFQHFESERDNWAVLTSYIVSLQTLARKTTDSKWRPSYKWTPRDIAKTFICKRYHKSVPKRFVYCIQIEYTDIHIHKIQTKVGRQIQ